jgi:hypothetical protein
MARRFVSTLVFCALFSCASGGDVAIAGSDGENNYDFDKFTNKEVGLLLDSIPRQFDSYHYITEPVGVLQGCSFFYGDFILDVYINGPWFLEPFLPDLKWDFALFRKETIRRIEVGR